VDSGDCLCVSVVGIAGGLVVWDKQSVAGGKNFGLAG
jgi:hypothetical protein